MTNIKWKDVDHTKHCPRCGLRGEHECLPSIEVVAQNRKADHADPSARVRLASGER